MSHWYSADGKPQHFIRKNNGDMRDSTLRDARKFNWLPSVTGILDTLDKPGLERWKQNQVLLAALTLPKVKGEDLDTFSKRVMRDAFVASREARDRGSVIHAALEYYFGGGGNKPAGEIGEMAWEACQLIWGFIDDSTSALITEAVCIGNGYGGMVDLHNDNFCIDYKTKDIKDSDWDKYQSGTNPAFAYPEHCMQLSAYDKALGGKGRRLINVFVDRNIAGRVVIYEWKENMYDRFELLVKYWQLSKNYFPTGSYIIKFCHNNSVLESIPSLISFSFLTTFTRYFHEIVCELCYVSELCFISVPLYIYQATLRLIFTHCFTFSKVCYYFLQTCLHLL